MLSGVGGSAGKSLKPGGPVEICGDERIPWPKTTQTIVVHLHEMLMAHGNQTKSSGLFPKAP